MKNLNRYISATQLGITLASLGLGWIGEPALAGLMDRFLAMFGIHPPAAAVHTVAGAATAFIIITFLHIVLGELTPKAIALVKAEAVSRYLVVPLMIFAKVMSPAIAVLYGAANWLMRKIGIALRVGGAARAFARGASVFSLCRRARTAHSTRPTPRCSPACSTFTRRKRTTSCVRERTSSRWTSIRTEAGSVGSRPA